MASIKLAGDTSGEVTISAPAVAGTTTLELPATSSTLATQNSLGVRNRIINGDMRIDQRNAGASVTPTSDSTYTLDRWIARLSQSSKYSVQQVADAPNEFINSIKITSLSSYSVTSSDFFQIGQYVEGLNARDLMWGTANAKTVTLSFWVKSSLTGTFGGTIFGYQTGIPSYPFSYTILAANTWEQKTVTITGPTSGTFNTNNSGCFTVLFSFGVGSSLSGTANTWNYSTLYRAPTGATSVVGTSGATFYITGVQLEVGTEATPFEHRPYDMELARCQRYYFKMTADASGNRLANAMGDTTVNVNSVFNLPTSLRNEPSVTYSNINVRNGSTDETISGLVDINNLSNVVNVVFSVSTTATAGAAYMVRSTALGGYIDFSSEL